MINKKCCREKLGSKNLVLDAVEKEEMIVVLSLLMWGCKWWLRTQWGEAQEHESLHQVSAVGTILADAQHNAIAVQLLFGEFQKRQERLLAGFVCQCLGQCHVQDVIVVIQDRVPAWWNLVSDMELDGDTCWWLLRYHLRDEIVFIVAFTVRIVLSTCTVLLFQIIFNLLVDERQLMFSRIRVISIWRRFRDGIERCLASVINYKWRLIVIGSLFCNYIRSTTAAPLPAWRNTMTTTPTNCWMSSKCVCCLRCSSLNLRSNSPSFYYYLLAHDCSTCLMALSFNFSMVTASYKLDIKLIKLILT